MATFYIQLKDKLQKISGDLMHDNIIKALGYTPSNFSGNFNDLSDNPFTQNEDGKFNITDEQGNIIACIDNEGIHSIDFIAGEHILSNKANKDEIPSLNGYATEGWIKNQGFAQQSDLENIDFNTLKENPFSDDENGELNIADNNGNVILKVNENGLQTIDVIAGDHILSNKVDKESGKGLSTEDFTTALKTKLQSLSNYDDTTITEAVNNLRGDFDTLVSGDTTTAIKTFNEIIAFLEGVEDTESLEGIIAGIEQQIANIEMPSISHLATKEELNNLDFYDIKNNPVINGEDGKLVFVDESGNIGLQLEADNTLYVKDVVAGDDVLSNKMDITDNLVRIEDADGELDEVPEDVCVKYVSQSLTEEQKEQVRENIDAVSPNEFKTFNGESLIGTGDIELNLDSVINYDLNVKAINHRGYSYEAPENTIPAYIMSKKKGFTYVEGDVSFTKDGVAVLLHDATIDRTSNGTGNINDLNYQEVLQYDFGSWFSKDYAGVKIPTFTEWVVLCKNLGLHPYIELKSSGGYTQEQITQIVNEVTRCGMKGKVTYISFNETYLGYVKASDADARLGYLCNPKGGFTSTQINKCKALKTTTNEVFLDARHMEGYLDVTEAKVDLCIAAGLPLEVWSINSEDVILNMPKYISGVTSDYLIAGKVLYNNSLNYKPPVSNWVNTNSISLDKTLLNFDNKEPITITAILDPTNASDPVIWKSSNTSVATVNNGIVTPIAEGNCSISATSDEKTATCSVVVEFVKYTISNTLLGCSLNNETSTVVIGDSFSAEIIPSEGYSLKNAHISITMDGVDITSTAYSNGIITISSVIGNVEINISCVEVPVYTITRNLLGCTSNNSITTIGEGNPYNETFTSMDGFDLSRGTQTITMNGADITSTAYSNGVLTITEVTGDIVINVTAYQLQTYTITRNLVGCTSENISTEILEDSNYLDTIYASDGYILNNAIVSITMGGVDITSSYSNGVINITNVNGDIIINIEAFEIPVVEPAEWEVIRTLTSNDILYGVGSNGSNGKVSSYNTPYTQDLSTRMGYYIPDIPVEAGYRYKIEYVPVVSTAQVGVQCVTQNWVDAYNNFTINESSPVSVTADVYDTTWQHSGFEFDLPTSFNNSQLKAMRLTFRNSGSNPNVSNGDIISVTISRRPIDSVMPIVDLDMSSIVDNKLLNKGTGGSIYNATLNTTSTSDNCSIVDGTLQLKNHAYAEIPYGFNASTPFTIVIKGKINTKSSKKYQRMMRTNVDAPSLYYSTNSNGLNVKLSGVQGDDATTYNSLGDFRGSNSLCIDYSNSTKITEETNMQEYKWISDGVIIKFYFNGILLGSQNVASLAESTSIGLGDNDTGTSYYATLITISEFKIYNQALSV